MSDEQKCPNCGGEVTGKGVLTCYACENRKRDTPPTLREAELERRLDQAEEREKRLRRVVNMVRVVDRPNTGARDHRFVALYIREKVCLLAGKGLASLLSEADVNEVAEALACLQYPDNGRHYCRWCSAGTHNDRQHEEHCGYAAQCRKIEGVRAKAKALAASEGPEGEKA